MVISHTKRARRLLILRPDRSMSWQTNKKILLAMFAINMAIGIGFAMAGAWLILPFAGLEIVLVGIGMYYVSWKLNFQETITIDAESFRLQKGVYYPKQSWQWQTSNIELLTRAGHYRMSPPSLILRHLNDAVEIGTFLNRADKKRLRQTLKEWGIRIKTLPRE